ncbi:MAG: AAA family ATPase [Mesoaciditoga sp.]|nr:MAG: AAA family ATPase [Mesoaciditoga sp.]
MSYEHVRELLKEMKLDGISLTLDSTFEEWSKSGKDATELIEELLEAEKKSLKAKKYDVALRYSGFPFHKHLDEFDFTFQPSIDVKKIKELKTLRFMYEKENVIFLGPPGVGKTHLAVGLGMEGIKEGKKVYFINSITLVDKLKKSFYERSFEKQMRFYKALDLLIIDELGYLPLDSEGAKLFFELISEKYEQGSVIVTSNRSFNEWNKIFEDEVIATAVLDRLLHHSTIINIRGKSYRLREKQKSGMIRLDTSKIIDENAQN